MKTKKQIKEYQKRYRELHRNKHKAYCKKYNQKHKEEIKQYKQKWLQLEKNKLKHAESNNRYNMTHKKQKAIYDKIYRKKNREKILEQKRIYRKNKFRTDLNFKLAHYIRMRIKKALQRNSKQSSSLLLINCSIDFLKLWIQFQFTKGMNWHNYGKYWEIDHIRPCASFNLTDYKQQRECFNYTNLQPLLKTENRKKGKKYIDF
jgi:hypothetical protein